MILGMMWTIICHGFMESSGLSGDGSRKGQDRGFFLGFSEL